MGSSLLYLITIMACRFIEYCINQTQINNNGLGILVLNEKNNGSMDLKISNSEISGNRGDGLSLYEKSLGGRVTAEVNNSAITDRMGVTVWVQVIMLWLR